MKVAIYARVSTEEQRERQSIDTQKYEAERHCIRENITVAGFYLDDGVSGSTALASRPDGARLLADARAGQFDAVLVYMYDRLARDVYEGLTAARTLKGYGVRPISILEPYDINTPEGEYQFVQSLNNAQLWKAQYVRRSIDGTNRLARDGQWMGGIRPYGYRVEGADRKARLAPSEEPIPGLTLSEGAIVRMIYAWLSDEGRSCVWIADQLTGMGVPPAYVADGREAKQRNTRAARTAGIWRPSRVRNLVVNTTYKGVHRYGKRSAAAGREVIEREVPALVPEEVWERAQETLRRNQLMSSKNAKRQYLLRGLMKCGLCGLTYIGTGYPLKKRVGGKDVPTGEAKSYYVCNGKHGARGIYGDRGQRCPSKAVPGAIEDAIWGEVEASLRNPGEVLARLQDRMAERTGDAGQLRQRAADIGQAMRDKSKERDIVVSLFRRGRIDETALDRQLDLIQQEEAALKEEAARLTRQAQGAEEAGAQLRSAEDLLRELSRRLDAPLTWELKRQLIETLVEGIVVETEGDEAAPQHQKRAVVTARYRFGGQHKAEVPEVDTRTGVRACDCLGIESVFAVRARGGVMAARTGAGAG